MPAEPLVLPSVLNDSLRLSPEQFTQLCQANPEAVLELQADGSILAMPPTGGDTGAMNSTLNALLWQALTLSVLPMKLFDSSTGFVLPDRSVLSPDAALVSLDRWQGLSEQQRRAFPPLCPDLVVELASPRDEGPRGPSQLRKKMAAYQRNGARLGWLLIPAERAVEAWGPLAEGLAGVRLENATRLDGAPQFPGLSIDLGEIWSA
jgi:Uma2 family endonuclease